MILIINLSTKFSTPQNDLNPKKNDSNPYLKIGVVFYLTSRHFSINAKTSHKYLIYKQLYTAITHIAII